MTSFQALSDKLAISLSTLCAIHCLLLPVLAVSLPSILSLPIMDESFHFWMIFLVVPLSVISLFWGCKRHGRRWLLLLGAMGLVILSSAAVLGHEKIGEQGEKFLTLFGASLIALGHFINYRLCQIKPPKNDPQEACH